MARRAGLALIWAILLAVPLRTMAAAAAMLPCISHGPDMALSAAGGADMPQHAMAQRTPGEHSAAPREPSDGPHDCAGHSVCHPAVALPAGTLEAPALDFAVASDNRASAPAVHFLTSGPERPPRASRSA